MGQGQGRCNFQILGSGHMAAVQGGMGARRRHAKQRGAGAGNAQDLTGFRNGRQRIFGQRYTAQNCLGGGDFVHG